MLQKIEVSKKASFSGHRDCIYALECLNENQFVSAGSDGLLVNWDINQPDNGVLIANVSNSVYAAHYLSNEHHLLVGQNFEGVYKIDLQTKTIIQSAQVTNSQIFDIKSDSRFILIATGNGQLLILSREDLSVINKVILSDKSVRCIAVNPQHGSFALGLSDNTIKVFSFDGFKKVHDFNAHKNSVFALAFSPDGKYLLSGSRDASIQVWNAEQDYSLQFSIPAHMFAINDIKFNSTGEWFATASMDKTIKIWDARQFRLLKVIDKARYESHRTSVNKLIWIGNQLASASDDKLIFLWNIDSI